MTAPRGLPVQKLLPPAGRSRRLVMRWLASSFLLLSFFLSGCATKHYGRLADDATPSDCAAIAAQLAEIGQFRKAVARESEFSGADVVAFLLDFGIGNAMAKSEALKSADEREAQLKGKQQAMGCEAESVLRADARGR